MNRNAPLRRAKLREWHDAWFTRAVWRWSGGDRTTFFVLFCALIVMGAIAWFVAMGWLLTWLMPMLPEPKIFGRP